jgi:two-component system cell cycle sensor histidine kinase/response regulator CckA
MQSARIMVVEDEAIIAMDLATRLRGAGHEVVAIAASGEQALQHAASHQPDLVLMDIVLQGAMDGIETAARLRESIDVPVLFLTSHSDPATIHSAIVSEPYGYLLKPYNERELQAAIQVALYRHRTEGRLRKLERWLSATMASIGDAVIATDLQGKVILINPVARRLTGRDEAQAVGLPFEQVFRAVRGPGREPVAGLLDKGLQGRFEIQFDDGVVLQTADGAEVPIDDSISPILGDDGEPTGVVVVFRDASERLQTQQAMQSLTQQLEVRVQQRTAQLEQANRALSAFSFSVSHDLRAPLRAVSGFGTLLAERCGETLDAEGQKFLDVILGKSQEMERMIDDFLRLYRLRHEPLHIVRVDTEALVRDVLRDLGAQYPRAAEVVAVEALPAVEADAGLLRILWVNLLGNALKFSARAEQPRVHVGARREDDGSIVFAVADNGAGFDPRHADRLFTMFNRLHPQREFDGHGIGLAIVSAVAERHGAQVSASGRPGLGATFELRWPAGAAPG